MREKTKNPETGHETACEGSCTAVAHSVALQTTLARLPQLMTITK